MSPADLRTARKALGMTQYELAEALDVRQATISEMENGNEPIIRRTELAVRFLATREGRRWLKDRTT